MIPSFLRRAASVLFLPIGLAACSDGLAVVAQESSQEGDGPPAMWETPAAAWRGEVLFREVFPDADLESRGWYDTGTPTLAAEGAPGTGSPGAFLCRFHVGASGCAGGILGRRAFPDVEAVHLTVRIRYDSGWVGSGRPYHPHEFHFLTNADHRFVGPARTHLTLYVEQVEGTPLIALQDSRNVNPACIRRNDGVAVGCDGGSVEAFPFGEDRSVAACNGLVGEVDAGDCFPTGPGRWYSSRAWRADRPVFRESAPADGPGGGGGWRLVEAYLALNSIQDGRGVPDGRIRLWVDGEEVVASDSILMRTALHPEMAFQHLLVAPYIGDGSPVDQSLRIGEITVARGIPRDSVPAGVPEARNP
ncbi:MAG: hypothetical protein EA422_05515 [Gemmatimonadales bacterium]|nr:MAG: hypothetical protein EA422_05515 [Gemmatimonadales bacterium]